MKIYISIQYISFMVLNKSVKSGVYIDNKCAIFDAIEISDCFIKLDRGNKDNES